MTKLDTLKQYQAWRRGSDDPMLDPTEIGLAIDYAIAVCEAVHNLIKDNSPNLKVDNSPQKGIECKTA